MNTCGGHRKTSIDGLAWLDRLPSLIEEACRGWDIEIAGEPYEGGVCGWVAPVRGASGEAVLKVSWPHAEAATEAVALRWWDGAGTVRLLAEGSDAWTMLLERCEPGTPLRDVGLPNERGLAIGAKLLNALWSKGAPPGDGPRFDSMAQVCDEWAQGAERRAEGTALRYVRSGPSPASSPWASSCSAGSPALRIGRLWCMVTSIRVTCSPQVRAPYLAIDPKPMLGDPAYDPWSLVAQLDWPFRLPRRGAAASTSASAGTRSGSTSPRNGSPPGMSQDDVQGGLWAASEGDAALGAKWIRSATITAPMLS